MLPLIDKPASFSFEARQRAPELEQDFLNEIVAVTVVWIKRAGHLEDQSGVLFKPVLEQRLPARVCWRLPDHLALIVTGPAVFLQ